MTIQKIESLEWHHSTDSELGMLALAASSVFIEGEGDIILPPEEWIKPRVPEKDEVFPPETARAYVEACGVESNADDPIEAEEIEFLLQSIGRAEPFKDTRILECGTGPGMLARLLMEQGGLVTATDVSPTMIQLAREKHAEAVASGKLQFEFAEARKLPFADDTFELVVAKHLLHQLPTEAAWKFLQEVVRVLQKDGVAVIGDYNRASSREDRDARLQFTLPEMQPLLEESFDASFTPNELILLLEQIPGIEFAVVLAEDPARLSVKLRERIANDPVKGHSTDWRTRLRVLIHKI